MNRMGVIFMNELPQLEYEKLVDDLFYAGD